MRSFHAPGDLRHMRASSDIYLCFFRALTRHHLDEQTLPPEPQPWPTCLACMANWLQVLR
jgi:hypothetical protein